MGGRIERCRICGFSVLRILQDRCRILWFLCIEDPRGVGGIFSVFVLKSVIGVNVMVIES